MLKKSTRKNKKYMLVLDNKKIHFGAKGYEDYTIHKDDKRKDNYIKRHKKRENWDKINPGSLSRFILWNKKTIRASLKDFNKRFGTNIKLIL